jgi:hypothetical protein
MDREITHMPAQLELEICLIKFSYKELTHTPYFLSTYWVSQLCFIENNCRENSPNKTAANLGIPRFMFRAATTTYNKL